jgi:hypothetical protein
MTDNLGSSLMRALMSIKEKITYANTNVNCTFIFKAHKKEKLIVCYTALQKKTIIISNK